MAYQTSYLDGGGSALEGYWDLRATAPGGKPWTIETVRPMMQHLLAQRFHLVVHSGRRELSGYGMVVAKGGLKLQTAAAGSTVQGQKAGEGSQNFVSLGRVQVCGIDSRGIASLLSAAVNAPVADYANLLGLFNLDLEYAPDNSADSKDQGLPSFFTAVEEQLGLRLQPEKVTVATIVIDHVSPEPTPN